MCLLRYRHYLATALRWAQRAAWRRLFKLAFLGVAAWFGTQYYDNAVYSLMAFGEPLQLGDVTSLTPDTIPHNTYVCIKGISEHRGMTQQVARVLGQRATPYWTFRLLGSRGVFVEVPPDPAHFGTTQVMQVCGRAIDPQRSPMYGPFIAAYARLYHTEVHPPTRLVQSGLLPGAHRGVYVLALSLLGAVTLAQTYAVAIAWTGRRRPPAPQKF